ncbi:beta-ketoacyl-[acyl-carrier-protein] synthase family protein [Nocardia sp. NPDC052001]|uniref:beta-ketoacyl-[acyl-carrier-protein] synthase family protein n=1 Tax=Nocardia sp. NPDC052001 TaxID=3154853 RepID=UPI00343E867F
MSKTIDRIVVSGMGAVTAFGIGLQPLWEGARAGAVAIRPVAGLPMAGYRTKLAGEVPEEVKPSYAGISDAVREPSLDFALVAAEEALTASGLAKLVPPQRWGVVFATCNGGLVSGEQALRAEASGQPAPFEQLLLVSPQTIAEVIGAAFGFGGPVLSVNTACASGAHAIAHAVELLRDGHADALLVGGSDSLSGVTFAGFNSLESLSPNPAAPYSKGRDGLSLGEGSGMLVLTRAEIAAAHDAPVLAEVLGYGLSADGYHATAPHPEGAGAARAIVAALASGGVRPEHVGYVNGHGTGTPKNDPAEVAAVRTAFGDDTAKTLLSSTKSMIGHLLGAAGAVESIVTVQALREQTAPPTAGFLEADPHCAIDVVPGGSRPLDTAAALSNNFAFAGANASILFGLPGRIDIPAPADEPIVITGLAALGPDWNTIEGLHTAYRDYSAADRRPDRFAALLGNPEWELPPRERRRVDRLGRYAIMASAMALADAGLAGAERPAPRIGVVLGTGLGPLASIEEFVVPLVDSGPESANPAVFPNTVYNAAAGQVAMKLGLTGVTSTLTAAHAAGAAALCVARDLLRRGTADAIVVPAVDTFCAAAQTAYGRLPAFARSPEYIPTEGGYGIVLEPLSKALARGAVPRAEFAGFGMASDGRGIGEFDTDGSGFERAMRAALTHAGLTAAQVTRIQSNAAGIEAFDTAEFAAIGRVFDSTEPFVETPKRWLGEPVGAGAHLAIALAAEQPLDKPVLINSSSPGGTHISVVLTPVRTADDRSTSW